MTNPGARFTITNLDEIDELPVVGGALRWKPVRRTLGIGAFGTNAYVADAGELVVEPHDELDESGTGGHQELYVVLDGRARFTVDGTDHDVARGGLVFLADPAVRREAVALQDGTTVLAVGAPQGEAFTPSEWEDRFVAEGEAARARRG